MSQTHFLPEDFLAQLRAGDEQLDRAERGPAPELALLGQAGLLIAPLPRDAGGKGWGTSLEGAVPMLEVLADLGSASLAAARIYEGHVNALRLVIQLGTQRQQEGVAEQIHSGAIMAVWTADGSDPVRLETSPEGTTLHGGKAFASGLGDVTLAVVSAATEQGLQLVLADATDASRFDHSGWDMHAMVGSRSGRFDCTGLPAGATHRLGDADAFFAEPDFHGGIWRLCACYSGAMMRLVDDLALLINRRDSGDDALGLHRMGLAAIEAETSALWAREACIAAEIGTDPNRAISAVLFAREAIEHSAARLIALAERIGGTQLHHRSSDPGRTIRDLRLYLRQAQLDGKLALATGCWQHWRTHMRQGLSP